MIDILMKWNKHVTMAVSLVSFLLIPIDAIAVEVFKAKRLLTSVETAERSQGFHQHNASFGILVNSISGRFGIHRFDFSTGNIETLKVVNRNPVFSFTPEPFVTFQTVGGITFIDIRGQLFSTDGTRQGTQFIRDFGVSMVGGSPGQSERSNILLMSSVENQLLFSVFDPNAPRANENVVQLIVSDGTRLGTKKIGANFSFVAAIFTIRNETFLFAETNGDSGLQVLLVSEKGSRLSTILTTSFLSIGSLVVDSNAAYFCLDGSLALFSNRSLTIKSAISCSPGGSFYQNRSGVFFTFGEEIFSFDPITETATALFTPSEGVRMREVCSTDDTLLVNFSDSNRVGRILAYSSKFGVREIASTSDADDYLFITKCLLDRVVINQRFSGPSIYDFNDSARHPIRGELYDDFSLNIVGEHQDKIYALNSSRDDNFETISFIELSRVELNTSYLVPVVELLLED